MNAVAKPAYLRTAAVRRLIRANGHRAGLEFLMALDRRVSDLVIRACAVHNGGRKTLDGLVLNYVLGNLKGRV